MLYKHFTDFYYYYYISIVILLFITFYLLKMQHLRSTNQIANNAIYCTETNGRPKLKRQQEYKRSYLPRVLVAMSATL